MNYLLNQDTRNFNYTYSVCFSPDGMEFATGAEKGFVYLWNTKIWKIKKQFKEGH